MRLVDERRELFENLERLRRAQRARPKDADIASVRGWLEDALGPSVSIRLAAALLGVSHSSLLRWIDRGDIPTVITPSGHRQVPVDALFELRADVARERAGGRMHVLQPVLDRARERAERIDTDSLLADAARGGGSHRLAELRGLAYHRVLAPRLTAELIVEARHTLSRWRRRGTIHEEYARLWGDLLDQPLPLIREAITADSEHARDLRQSSPLAGLLSEPERRRIVEQLS